MSTIIKSLKKGHSNLETCEHLNGFKCDSPHRCKHQNSGMLRTFPNGRESIIHYCEKEQCAVSESWVLPYILKK